MHIGKVDTEVKRQIAIDLNNAAKRKKSVNQVADEWAGKLNRSRMTIYRYARDHGYRPARKKRADAFKVSAELEKHLTNILYIYHRKSREGGSESSMWFSTAVEIYQNHMKSLTGYTVSLPSISWMQQIARRWQVSRKHAKEPTSHIELRSLHPNHVHEIDFSLCRYYLEPDNKIIYLKRSQDYKNKVGDYTKKRRLVRMIIIDHTSGAFFVEYFFGQKIEEIAEFLYHAWENKGDDYIFHGTPKLLLMDNDKALHSHAMMRLFKYLNIDVPEVLPEAPRVKGTVEGMMRIWEAFFEMRFLFEKSGSIVEINRWARREAIRLQQTKKHRRHGKTRFGLWDGFIEGHLREMPDYTLYKQMLYSQPETRVVQKKGKLEFRGKKYTVTDTELYGSKVSVIVHPYLYNNNGAITIQFPPEGMSQEDIPFCEVKTYVLAPDIDSNFGFSQNAVTFGEYAQKKKKTHSEKNFQNITEADISGHEIRPFSDSEKPEAGKFPTRMGEKIIATPDYSGGPMPITKFKAKHYLSQLLGRNLTEADLSAFDEHFKERTVFEADVEGLAANLLAKTPQAKEA